MQRCPSSPQTRTVVESAERGSAQDLNSSLIDALRTGGLSSANGSTGAPLDPSRERFQVRYTPERFAQAEAFGRICL